MWENPLTNTKPNYYPSSCYLTVSLKPYWYSILSRGQSAFIVDTFHAVPKIE